MKLLIIGGTRFVGRHLAEAALARGHELTLFNRGKSGADLFPEVEKLQGDRTEDLSALRGRSWDAVIDTCGYTPRAVRMAAEILKDAVGLYIFISSISVYADQSKPGLNEEDEVGKLEDETVEEITGTTYGPLKALCEQALEEVMPGRVLNIRPGLIVGPHDPTDRFTYWPWRVALGGDVLAPGRPEAPVQFIDARDLAQWTVKMAEEGGRGLYNAVGPDYDPTMQDLLNACKQVSGSDARFYWVDEAFLLEHDVKPFMDLPLWLTKDAAGLATVDYSKASGAGLSFRPLQETVRDTLIWDRSRPEGTERRAGLTLEREQALLTQWLERRGRTF